MESRPGERERREKACATGTDDDRLHRGLEAVRDGRGVGRAIGFDFPHADAVALAHAREGALLRPPVTEREAGRSDEMHIVLLARIDGLTPKGDRYDVLGAAAQDTGCVPARGVERCPFIASLFE